MLAFWAIACGLFGPDYGPYNSIVRLQRSAVEASPCDSTVVRALVGTLEKVDVPAALEAYRAYEGGCEDREQGLTSLHAELERTDGDLELALALGQRLFEAKPTRVRATFLAKVLDKLERTAEALAWRRQAVGLDPKNGPALKKLAKTEEASGSPCSAYVRWRQLRVVDWLSRGEASVQAERLLELPACANMVMEGTDSVRSELLRRAFVFPVEFGDSSIDLMTDSASAWTYATKDVLKGVVTEDLGQELSFKTAWGHLKGDLKRVDQLRIGAVQIHNVQLVVVPRLMGGLEGALGRNVLARISLRREVDDRWTVTAD
ncbi:MAG: aspartyl protease family protein [Myxococcota bacterium]